MKLSLLALLALATPLTGQTVRTVGFGGAYFSVQDAVDAAADGDLVLILPGHNDTGFVIDGKSLTVLGTSAEMTSLTGGQATVRVFNLSADQFVVLRGLDVREGAGVTATVELDSNAGMVWIEEVEVRPILGHGIVASASADVVMVDCHVAGFPPFPVGDGGHGVLASDSSLHVFDSFFQGVHGGDVTPGTAGDGGDGLRFLGPPTSFLSATGSEFRGGPGGSVSYPDCSGAGAGGDGLALSDSPTFLHDTVAAGGPSGVGGIFGCPWDGEDVSGGAALVKLPGRTMTLTATSPISEGGLLIFHVDGPPLVPAFLGLGAGPDAVFLSSLSASLVLQAPLAVLGLGLTDSLGVVSLSLPLPLLPPGLDFSMNWGQSGYVTPLGQVVLGAPTALPVLDAAF